MTWPAPVLHGQGVTGQVLQNGSLGLTAMDWGTFERLLYMLKLILSLVTSAPVLWRDVEGVVNEVKDAPNGAAAITNAVSALRQLADDLEKALGE